MGTLFTTFINLVNGKVGLLSGQMVINIVITIALFVAAYWSYGRAIA